MRAKHDPDKPLVLGLTGGIGSGKSTVASFVAETGIPVIDADAISRALTMPGGEALPDIRAHFGDGVFGADGALDRGALAAIVFADTVERHALEAILHPAVQRIALQKLDEATASGAQVVALDVPLLFETAMDSLCDEIWVCSAPESVLVQRVMNRDRATRAQVEARIAAQMPLSDKEKLADRVIQTNKPLPEIKAEIARLCRDLLRRR